MGNAELGSIRIDITFKSNGTKNEKQYIYVIDMELRELREKPSIDY